MKEAFPVLWPYRTDAVRSMKAQGCPKAVPWSLLAPHEARARRNHSQSLERLAERGGLSPAEMVDVIRGLPWDTTRSENAVPILLQMLREHEASATEPGVER